MSKIPVYDDVLTGAQAWLGPELQDETTWVHQLSESDADEIETAVRAVQAKGLEIPFAAGDFEVPQLSEFLRTIPGTLEDGPGFMLVRGLPRERFTAEECELIYWGLGVQFGTPISQNSRGHLLGHVRDEGKTMDDPNARAYQTKSRLDFHCDQLPVDILGLFCVQSAKSGGASALVSAYTVHNVLRKERPDLLEELYQPYYVDWRGENPPSEAPFYECPMFSYHEGKLAVRFASLAYFRSVSRYGEEYAMTAAQAEALDYVQQIANRPALRLTMMFQPGDMQFINNHTILHSREAFEDYDEIERKRHLLRMWIAYPEDQRRSLSPLLAERYRFVEMGGIPKRVSV